MISALWQSIETAPNDVSLLITNGDVVMAGKITNFAGQLWFDPTGITGPEFDVEITMNNATHWMICPDYIG